MLDKKQREIQKRFYDIMTEHGIDPAEASEWSSVSSGIAMKDEMRYNR